MSYCRAAKGHAFHGPYHDREYGFPIRSDPALLERLALEINQAGLSWLTMLVKRDNFRRAFAGFDPERVAAFGARERRRLLADAGIVRNRLKIAAVIENARRILAIRRTHGSFAKWLDAHHPRPAREWEKLFKKTFVFTGGEIVKSFLLSTGYLSGAHVPSCPTYAKVAKKKPAWMRAARPARRSGIPRYARDDSRSANESGIPRYARDSRSANESGIPRYARDDSRSAKESGIPRDARDSRSAKESGIPRYARDDSRRRAQPSPRVTSRSRKA